MKTCTQCGETKSLDDFHRLKKSKDGRNSWCRECYNAHKRNRYATDPDYAERMRQLDAARYRGEKLEPLPKKSDDERFDEKWVEDEDGCWIWQACTNEQGYGRFGVEDKLVLAHRWSYARAYGGISDEHECHHACGKRACVNPKCLLAVTEEAHRELHAA